MSEANPPDPPRVADVLVPVAVDQPYSYRLAPGMTLAEGDFVAVSLGSREVFGVVWALRNGAADNLKPVSLRLDLPPLSAKLRGFVDWVAAWTLAPSGMVLRMTTRAAHGAGAEPVRIGLRLTGAPLKRETPARKKALEAAKSGLAFGKTELARQAGVSISVIDGLIDEGALEPVALPPEKAAEKPDPDFTAPLLSPAQAEAAQALNEAVASKAFKPILLEGVTGSGKTEVYFEAVAQALREGGQALILMPEIALTAQFLDRFAARFGHRPAEWHSGLSPRRRARVWRGAAEGDARVVAGARSALFLPFSSLRLIVVDEEHEAAYKQDEGVIYHARDMAVVRARIESATVVLASATPSIETRENARLGRYAHLRLESRFAGRDLPSIEAIDLRKEGASRGKWISPRLVEAMRENFARDEQVVAVSQPTRLRPPDPVSGLRPQVPVSELLGVAGRASLTGAPWSAIIAAMSNDVPKNVRPATAVDTLNACGPGVERLAEEAGELFPDARLLVLSSDMPGGTERMRTELQAVAEHHFDLVIGTQLVAKGHNFPFLTLVGVVDADVGLSNGDPRAAERTFQLLNQVAGRAGRGEKPGRALLQTFQKEHPVLRALLSGDFERFYREETQMRRDAHLPPFGRLAAAIVAGPDRAAAETHARALARAACLPPEKPGWSIATSGQMPGEDDIVVLGPAEAPIAMVRSQHRFRLLIKAPRRADLQGFLRQMLAKAPRPQRRHSRVNRCRSAEFFVSISGDFVCK